MDDLPDTLTLTGSRLKWLGLIIPSALFVAGGIWMLIEGEGPIAWLTIIFFGACVLAFLWQLISPGELTLDRDGFRQRLAGRTLAHAWTDVSAFGVYAIKQGFFTTNKFVCFDRSEDDGKRIAALNRALVGASAQLGDTFGMKAEALAELMNRFQQRALRDKGLG